MYMFINTHVFVDVHACVCYEYVLLLSKSLGSTRFLPIGFESLLCSIRLQIIDKNTVKIEILQNIITI